VPARHENTNLTLLPIFAIIKLMIIIMRKTTDTNINIIATKHFSENIPLHLLETK